MLFALKLIGFVFVLAAAAITGAAYRYGFIFNPSPTKPPKEKSMYEFTMKDIDGKDVKLDAYKGKVAMIVNVASKCGLTPQYEGLEALYEKYKTKALSYSASLPTTFMGQEPGTEKEIKEFCTLKYNVTFPMFAKISVKGKDQHPFYTFLTNKQSNPGSTAISHGISKIPRDKNGKVHRPVFRQRRRRKIRKSRNHRSALLKDPVLTGPINHHLAGKASNFE
jgi:glutathione peroxidase